MPASLKGEPKPLNERFIETTDAGGGKMSRPALDSFWVETVDFPSFPALPIEWDDATEAEWQQRLSFIEEDLQWLLKLPHHEFWSQCVHDSSLQQCLDSYLKNAPRYYDMDHSFPPSLSGLHRSVHRLVFMAFLRLSTHKESKENFISPAAFGEIIYNNYIFDAVKLLELSVLYGRGNHELLSKMIENIIKQQPNYLNDLKMVVPTISEAFDTIMMRCGFKENTADTGPTELSDKRQDSDLASKPIREIRDMISFITDSALSLQALLEVYPPAAHVFFDQGFVLKVSSFCEFVLPALAATIQEQDIREEQLRKDLWQQLVAAKVGFAKVCHNIILACCIQPVLDSSGHDDMVVAHVEQYLDTLSSLLSDKMFLAVLAEQGNIQEDLELVLQSSPQIDEARTGFLLEGINTALEMYSKKVQPLAPKTVAQKNTEEHQQGDFQTDAYLDDHVAVMGAAAPRKTGVELESLITEVKDLLPDLGDGFVEVCLEEYNYDSAKLINDILEDKLPPSLHELDRTIPRANPPPAETVPSEPDHAIPPSLLAARENVYDGDEFDLFAGKDVDTSKIHKGKKNDNESNRVLDDKSEMKGLRSTYEDYYFEYDDEYEDEYDDTYDTHNVGAQDNDSADELTSIRPFTQPRVLQGKGNQDSEEGESSGAEDNQETAPDQRPPARDEFVPSEYHRGGRGASQGAVRGRGRGGRGGGGGNEANRRRGNERHKGSRANHNRKAQASRKRGRGMFPS